MKKHILILCLAFASIQIFGQDQVSNSQNNNFDSVWYPVYKDGKMKYINNKGQILTTNSFDPLPWYELKNFTKDFIIIKSGDVVGAFTKSAVKILDFDFSDIYYDENSNIFRATLKKEAKESYFGAPKKVGFYNIDGKVLVPPTFICSYFDCGYDFNNGLCYMCKDGKIGFINTKGNWVIEPQFYFTSGFVNGFATVVKEKKGNYGVIDEKGILVIPFNFKNIFNFSKTGIAPAVVNSSTHQEVLLNTKGEIIKKLGKLRTISAWTSLIKFDNGNFVVLDSITNKKGIINEDGKIICEPKYNGVTNSTEGNILVANIDGKKEKNDSYYEAKGGNWVLVNATTGKEICKPIIADQLNALSEGLIAFKQNGKWGYLNVKGETIISPTYEFEPSTFRNGLARIYGEKPGSLNNDIPLMGYIDKTGKIIWEIQH